MQLVHVSLQLCVLLATLSCSLCDILLTNWDAATADSDWTNWTEAIGLKVAAGGGSFSITALKLNLASIENTNIVVELQGSAESLPDGTVHQTFSPLEAVADENATYIANAVDPFTLTEDATFWVVLKLMALDGTTVSVGQAANAPVDAIASFIGFASLDGSWTAYNSSDTTFLNFEVQGAAVVDCLLGNWTEWDACSAACGGGYHSRTRPIEQAAQQGGACGTTTETGACNTDVCPVNCSLGAWTEWSNCTVACGGGMTTHTRPITVQPVGTGLPCGATQESQTCNTNPCPVNCAVGDWSAWTGCLCEYHVAGRARPITTPASGGGIACPATYETRACEAGSCQSPSPGKLPKDPSTSPDNAAPSVRPSVFAMLLSLIAFVALLR